MNSNSKFYIIPRGLFISSVKNKLWLALCNKLVILYLSKCLKNTFNLGLLLLLLIYYITDLINIKIKHFKNFIKFYSKDERQGSIGNYFCFNNINNFTIYISSIKMLKNELLFDLTNYVYFIKQSSEFDIYQTTLNSKLNKIKMLVFSPLEE